jgi:hypothetical protein
MSFTLKTLTEGIRDRHVGQQNKRLVEKWSRTGLLRGMDDVNRENMATLLENQAAQVLRESNTMGGDSVGGFTNIAFPIVRRVFGGLVANELVSIQPMSLPSGLLFYLDYTYGSDNGAYSQGDSIYGSPTGKAIQDGADAVGGQYDLAGSGFSRVHEKAAAGTHTGANGAADHGEREAVVILGAETVKADADEGKTEFLIENKVGAFTTAAGAASATLVEDSAISAASVKDLELIQHDPQILDRSVSAANGGLGEKYAFVVLPVQATLVAAAAGTNSQVSPLSSADASAIRDLCLLSSDNSAPGSLALIPAAVQSGTALNVKRLTQLGTWDSVNSIFTPNPQASLTSADTHVLMVVRKSADDFDADADFARKLRVSFVKADNVTVGTGGEADGTPAFESNMKAAGDEISPVIPEIDIKIESIPVTAQTRKLRARWSPELAQDLNAYHSMDAEVELTQILSEQIALEIDREILGDLLSGAKGANFFWSRSPGKFVNKRTGAEIARASTLNPGPAFTGTVREWYETLTETVIDVANEIHRKTLRGSANFIVVSPDVATILEASVLYRPSYSLDGDGQVGAPFTMGAEKVGTLSNRFTVYKDPYFPRNKILVGYKGGSYLETGFVYAPYVPLIVTPTIFQPEDFTPRKGVMTRYGKKMVRADFYGTVTCLDMNVI